jgi:hypothetical protein
MFVKLFIYLFIQSINQSFQQTEYPKRFNIFLHKLLLIEFIKKINISYINNIISFEVVIVFCLIIPVYSLMGVLGHLHWMLSMWP